MCKKCGAESIALGDETAQQLDQWTQMHPLRGIPNWPDVPLFPTKDERRIQAVLDWSAAHPGERVPEDLMMSVRADENDLEARVIRTLVQAGALETMPHVVWTFHMTGFMPSREAFESMPKEDQAECEVAWAQWETMDTTARAQFAARIRAYAATLPA